MSGDNVNVGGIVKLVVGAAVGVFLLIAGCEGTQTVKTGNRGVKVVFGKVEQQPLSEGLYFINPFTTHLAQMNVQTLKWEYKTEAYTKDVQKSTISYAINYGLDPTYAAEMYRTVGETWPDVLLPQVVNEEIKRQIGQVVAVDLVAQRDQIAREIERLVTQNMAQRHVIISGFRLTNIDYTPEFEKAVEAKVVAQQDAIREQNHTVQVQQQANQTVLSAEAEAKSMKIRADALSSNQKLVQWEAVQKWDGALPTIVLGGNAMPFINMNDLAEKAAAAKGK